MVPMSKHGLANKQTVLEVPPDLGHLPSTFAELVPLYRACIVRFDAAVHARDFDTAAKVHGEASELIQRAQSFDRFQGKRNAKGWGYCYYDVARIFAHVTRAAVGAVPLFGQAGDFITSLSTTKVRFKVDGLCSLGVRPYGARALGFSLHAVEWDRGFYSETGFRSFLCSSLQVGERTDDVKQWCLGHLRHWWNGEGGRPTKYALHRIRRASDPRPVPAPAPADEDEDDVLECSACAVDLSQMDEYGECSQDGAVFCPGCYAKHETVCPECLPLAEDFDDDGLTSTGNGYPQKNSVQLSLF